MAVLDQHLHPALCVSPHAQGLVVHRLVTVRHLVPQYSKDDPQHLVRQRHDRFLVPLADAQCGEFIFQRTPAARRRLRELAQQTPDPSVAIADLAHLALARTFVVARADAHPRGQPLGAAKALHLRADLHQQHGCAHDVDTRDDL